MGEQVFIRTGPPSCPFCTVSMERGAGNWRHGWLCRECEKRFSDEFVDDPRAMAKARMGRNDG